MRRMVLMLGVLLGCATAPPRDVADLVGEARANEVGAFAKNRDRRLRVSGVVTAIGLDQLTHVVMTGTTTGFGSATASATYRPVSSPYVVLAGRSGSPYDLVRCNFAPSSAEQVGNVTRGTALVVSGIFDQYAHQPPALTLMLSSCAIE